MVTEDARLEIEICMRMRSKGLSGNDGDLVERALHTGNTITSRVFIMAAAMTCLVRLQGRP